MVKVIDFFELLNVASFHLISLMFTLTVPSRLEFVYIHTVQIYTKVQIKGARDQIAYTEQ